MVKPFRFALQTRTVADHDALMAVARQAEALGYQELYSADHIGAADPFVPLVVAALATTRLRVGPLVLNNEFHHPALLARTAATVDRVTGGRLVLGWAPATPRPSTTRSACCYANPAPVSTASRSP